MRGSLAKEAGVIYVKEGLNTFTLKSGATFTIYTTPYTPKFGDTAFAYGYDEDRFNPPQHVAPGIKCITKNPIPDFPGVDILMTHGPAKGVLDRTPVFGNVGCPTLIRAVSRARPLLHCFGHIHHGYGAEVITWKDSKSRIGAEAIEDRAKVEDFYPHSSRFPLKFGKETLVVNAAIQDGNNMPTNAPRLVVLDLPCKTGGKSSRHK
jgi:hypothetical protein